jgi:hypothetical protein
MSRYVLVPGNPDSDREDVLLLGRYLPALTEDRYVKYYSEHPLGPPHFVLARTAQTREPIGMAALFPGKLRISGQSVVAGIAGDLSVAPPHRSLGPALLLERALLEGLGQSELRFAYAMPNRAAEPVFRRVGYTEIGRMTRFVKPLKTEFAVRAYVSRAPLAHVSSKLLDAAISATSREHWQLPSRSFVVERWTRFDERVSSLCSLAFERHRVVGERTPELLNWKYELLPGSRQRFSLLVARQGDALRGYLVTLDRDGIRHVVDLLFDSRRILSALLAELTHQARRDALFAVCVDYFGPRNELTGRLRAFGFFRRLARPVMIFVPDGESLAELARRDSWYLLAGDEDV